LVGALNPNMKRKTSESEKE